VKLPPSIELLRAPTALDEMPRLREAIGGGPRLFVKRDDVIPFGFGGNKVRKLQFVAAEAVARGADTLVTVGGIQSNHARATAAVAARLGLRCVIIANGAKPSRCSTSCSAPRWSTSRLAPSATQHQRPLWTAFLAKGAGRIGFRLAPRLRSVRSALSKRSAR
jgi:1-aminocyclopropane-1-carboxylate deaminase/D-cysteine desulfhydrase-like pyridoxal-dependent ACC family enzyme